MEKHLPKIWEVGEDDDVIIDEEDVDDSERLADRVANRLSDLLTPPGGETDGNESMLANALAKLSTHTTVAQEKAIEATNEIKTQIEGVKQDYQRQRLLIYIVVALLMLLLIVSW